jgi:outer membrane protein
MRDRAIVGLNAQNVEFLRAQVQAAEDRLEVGEGTRTDVAQANARLSAAESQYALSVASLAASAAVYQQVVGHAPGNLSAAAPVERLLPGSSEAAADLAMGNHPAIMASKLNSDVAGFNVKVAEGALLPSASLTASLSSTTGPQQNAFNQSASIGARLSIPLYSGGLTSSQVREAKERFGQSQIQVDVIRVQVRALVIANFGQLQAAKAQLSAAQAQVSASQLALEGIQEERNVGQRTTLDVLNAQQEVLNGRIALVRAQRDRVVASYALLAAIGRLNAEVLGLAVDRYYPEEHYHEVRDLWFGLRTPDGR